MDNKSQFKLNEEDYIEYLRDAIKELKRAYNEYILNPSDSNYWSLKEAIYSMSLDLKATDVKYAYTPSEIEEIKEYIWGLLL